MRCTGHCCERFPIGNSKDPLEYLRANADRVNDGDYILDMLLPIPNTDEHGLPLFTCRHFDTKTRNCKEYESRPEMCSDYPYGRACDHTDVCTYQPATEQ